MTTALKPTVLLADDEQFFRQVLCKILVDGGLTVIAEAADGAEAVLKFRESAPSLVFMEFFMPP